MSDHSEIDENFTGVYQNDMIILATNPNQMFLKLWWQDFLLNKWSKPHDVY